MYTVWAKGVKLSIALECIEDAIEFARESNMNTEVIDNDTGRIVWAAVNDEYSRYYVEVECETVVWLADAIE